MASFNKFMAVGYLTKDAEVKTLPNGNTEVAEFSIYTKEWAGRDKDLKTEYFDCSSFTQTVIDAVKRGLVKGTQIYVEGKMESRDYTDKNGAKVRRWQVKVFDFKYLQPKADNGNEGAEETEQEEAPAPPPARRTTAAPAPKPAARPVQTAPATTVDDDCPF